MFPCEEPRSSAERRTTPRYLLDRLHHMETLAAIQEGMASAERGELKPAAQVLDEMRAKYGLSR